MGNAAFVQAKARDGAFLASSVGQKVVMALTGGIFVSFVTVHMIGNLQAYLGAEAMNGYAAFLQGMLHGAGIWIFRGLLVASLFLHGWAATTLTLSNRAARPQGYRIQQHQAATWASRTMRWTGVFLGVFIVYHILHLTTGQAHPAFVKGDAYGNFVRGFQHLDASLVYIAAQLCLGFHLWHGAWSMTQTFGFAHPRYDAARRIFATVLTLVVVGGNLSFPIAVLTGVIR